MLTAKRIQSNREWLLNQRTRLQAELDGSVTVMHEDERPGLGTHMAEDASDVFEQAKNAAVVQRLRSILDLVNRALHKIDKGTYGPCEHCGQAIDPARLKALPYCALCMPCQAHAEQANRSR